MELSPEMLGAPARDRAAWSFESCHTVTSGRTGLRLIAQMLKTHSNDGVLLPSYLCRSMVQPFQEEGVSLRFFRIRADLTIDLNDLMGLVESVRPGAVLFVNYFGFPRSRAETETLCDIKERCWVIEDCAQGSLVEQDSPVVGTVGDWVITSLRKYLPLPDGGLVIDGKGLGLPSLPPATGKVIRQRLLGKFLRYEFLRGDSGLPGLEEAFLTLFEAAEDELDRSVPLQAMSLVSERLMGVMDLSDAMARRRRNYSVLLQAFAEEPRLPMIGRPLLPALPPGVSPLVFPILVAKERRDALRQQLTSQRVFCPVHWRLPVEVNQGQYSEAHELSGQMLGLPIDQRYSEEDMESLVNRLIVAWEKTA
jgi:dTDP-4-amino-4,6-dideoxygalactose transaminase